LLFIEALAVEPGRQKFSVQVFALATELRGSLPG
jgi:hypothetical protein